PGLLRSATLAALRPGEYRTGAVYTTGALFAEGEEDVERWAREGFGAVDLETAATYAVAEHFGMGRLAILHGFDNPRRREHLLLSDAEKDVRRAAADARVKRLALDLAVELSAAGGARPAAAPDGPVVRDCRPDEAEAVLALWVQAGAPPRGARPPQGPGRAHPARPPPRVVPGAGRRGGRPLDGELPRGGA